tara:strand:- start:7318 stop:8223 length:906 start_codon:yes stop_codon:yes gene_type:complete
MSDIGRLLTAMVTPFDGSGAVNYAQVENLAGSLADSGSDGLVVAGTTGESPTLTRDEQKELFSLVRATVPSSVSVVAGTGSNSTSEAIKYTADAQEAGVDACLLVVPYYNKPTQEGLFQHFSAIAHSTDLPCILYNVPSRTVASLSADTTVRLSSIPNIIGIKEASGDFNQISRIIKGTDSDFRVWSGNDNDTFGMMNIGGYGVISVASHIIGLQIQEMIKYITVGKTAQAAELHLELLDFFNGIFVVANPIPIKYLVNKCGIDVGSPRLPLVTPDVETATFLDALVARYHVDLVSKVSVH